MRLLRINFALVLVFTSVCSCSDGNAHKGIEKEKMKEIVRKQNDLLGSYFKAGDAEKLASLYTDSAKLSPDGADFVMGRENIKTFWANDFKSSRLLEMTTNVLTTNGTEDVIYETGKTTTKSLYKDSVYTFTVKYVNVWIRQPDGNYKLDIDFWNKDKWDRIVEKQINNEAGYSLSNIPFITMGNYNWSRGSQQRNDGFFKDCNLDIGSDGLHLTASGEQKIGILMKNFLLKDTTTFGWFR